MKPSARRRVTRTSDASTGRTVVLVPLANTGSPAVLFEDDYDAVLAAGVSPNWTLNLSGSGQPYVRADLLRRSRIETVARVIMKATPAQRVTYRDGNRLNLRRTNLRVVHVQQHGPQARAAA